MIVSHSLLKVFGRSPIKPLQQHISKTVDAVRSLMGFTAAVLNHDWVLATEQQQEVIRYEHEADDLKKDIRSHLPKSLFLPVSRSDLLEMLTIQDKIANKAKDIAGLVLGRKMHIPLAIANEYTHLLSSSLGAAELAHAAISELDELLESGFRGEEVLVVEDMISKLDQKEHENDELQGIVRQILFSIESELSPVDVVFLYKMLEWTGDIADSAHQVGSILQLLLAK